LEQYFGLNAFTSFPCLFSVLAIALFIYYTWTKLGEK